MHFKELGLKQAWKLPHSSRRFTAYVHGIGFPSLRWGIGFIFSVVHGEHGGFNG